MSLALLLGNTAQEMLPIQSILCASPLSLWQ